MAVVCKRSRRSRGFTLIELLAVVVIMGILATIGLVSFVGHMRQARTAEVRASIKAIAAAQERFRAENLQYADVSSSLTAYYPTTSPGATLHAFYGQTGKNNADEWERLRPQISGAVRCGYATMAGLPTETYPALDISQTVTWPETVAPWYVIQAICDQDADGVLSTAVATSFNNVVFFENEDE